MENIKVIGKWRIEHPTTINGRMTYKHAFISEHHTSGFVSLLGQGQLCYDGVVPNNQKVINYLIKLSEGLTN